MPRLAVLCACAAAVLLAVTLAACDGAGVRGFEEEIVVESYLVAGDTLAPVRLTRSAPLGAPFDYVRDAVQGADVAVEALTPAGAVAARYPYREDPDSAGVYRVVVPPGGPVPRAAPLGTYRLDARLPDDARLTAATTVPDTFRVAAISRDTAAYRDGPPVALTVTPSRVPGRTESFYVLAVEGRDVREDNLTPLAAEAFAQASEGEITLDDLRIVSTPVLNASGYATHPDGTLTVTVPWALVVFYGPNVVQLSALDDAMYDFVRSLNAQQNGLDPGAIPNVIDRVDGGIGIFGSLARVRVPLVFPEAD